MTDSGSTLARRALGRELRRLRLAAKIDQAQAARMAETSPQSIRRIEEGRNTRVTGLQTNALCNAYGATASERRILLALVQEIRAVREGKERWWRAYGDQITGDFDHYLALEEAAHQLSIWKITIVPGLLQTPDYRRAIAWMETPDLSSEELEKRIEWATRRQARLEDPEFKFDAIVSEAVLRDQIGGPGVMKDQCLHLVKVSELPNVSVRVVPFAARGHLGSLVGSFTMMEFPPLPQSKLIEPPVVYVEGYAGDLYLEREADLERYRDAWREISRVALGPNESRAFILGIAEEYGE